MILFDSMQLTDLVRNKKSIHELEIGPVQLGKQYACIDLFEITDVYVRTSSQDIFAGSSLTFRERLEQLKTFSGFIHLAGGLTCGIENQLITNFRITKNYLEPVATVKREEILQFYGTPDAELVEDDMYGGFNYAIDSYILVYSGKSLNFHVDPNTGLLKEISTRPIDSSHLRKR